jgi:hypothetical protein
VSPHVQARAEEGGGSEDDDDQGDIESDDERNEYRLEGEGGADGAESGSAMAAAGGAGADKSAEVSQRMSVSSAASADKEAMLTTADAPLLEVHPGPAAPDVAAVHVPVKADGASGAPGPAPRAADDSKQQPLADIATITDQGAVAV